MLFSSDTLFVPGCSETSAFLIDWAYQNPEVSYEQDKNFLWAIGPFSNRSNSRAEYIIQKLFAFMLIFAVSAGLVEAGIILVFTLFGYVSEGSAAGQSGSRNAASVWIYPICTSDRLIREKD
jgi:hypothetical protein